MTIGKLIARFGEVQAAWDESALSDPNVHINIEPGDESHFLITELNGAGRTFRARLWDDGSWGFVLVEPDTGTEGAKLTPTPEASMGKIKFVVQDENVFGYVDPRQPDTLCILAASPIRGASVTWMDGTTVLHEGRYRPATRADFDVYRISTGGYASDPERYDFPAI